MASNLADLRRSLVETRTRLREAQAALPAARARAERRAIDAAVAAAQAAQAANGNGKEKEIDPDKALGGNDKARERALVIVLADDQQYQAALSLIRGLEAGVDGIERDIEIERDARREREWAIRERLVAALDERGIAVEEATTDDGGVFDDVATEFATEQIVDQIPETSIETSTADDPDPFGAFAADDDPFAAFDTESAGAGAEAETEPPDLPPLDPNDPIARMVNGLKPSPTQAPETRMDDEWMSKLADYESAIAGCSSVAELAKLPMEYATDGGVDDQMRARLDEMLESRKKMLAKARK